MTPKMTRTKKTCRASRKARGTTTTATKTNFITTNVEERVARERRTGTKTTARKETTIGTAVRTTDGTRRTPTLVETTIDGIRAREAEAQTTIKTDTCPRKRKWNYHALGNAVCNNLTPDENVQRT